MRETLVRRFAAQWRSRGQIKPRIDGLVSAVGSGRAHDPALASAWHEPLRSYRDAVTRRGRGFVPGASYGASGRVPRPMNGGERRLRSSGGSSLRGRARGCRCVRSSNGARTAARWARAGLPGRLAEPARGVGSGRAEPPVWLASRVRVRRPPSGRTWPRASPASPLPCSSCIHLTNSRRWRRHFLLGASPARADSIRATTGP